MMFLEILSERIAVQAREYKTENGLFVSLCVSEVLDQNASSELVSVRDPGWGFRGDGQLIFSIEPEDVKVASSIMQPLEKSLN